MELQNYYKILEVSPEADLEEIKQAYRRLARKFHPDVSDDPEAEQKFKYIKEAYEILSDPQIRFTYTQSRKVIKPYSWAWLRSKMHAYQRTVARFQAKISAQERANAQLPHKRNPSSYLNQPTAKRWPLVLSLLTFAGLVIATTSLVLEKIEDWRKHQQIMTALFQNDKKSIDKLQSVDLETQKSVLQYEGVKKVVINFYITHPEEDVITQLERFDPTIQAIFFQDADLQKILLEAYENQIYQAVRADHFEKALQILDVLQRKFKNSPVLSTKYAEIKQKKEQRLSALEQQYQGCVEEGTAPLLERISCTVEVLRKIEQVSGESTRLVTDPNLPTMYGASIEQALTNKDYPQAEKLLSEWQTLFPTLSESRNKLRDTLEQRRQLENIISDLGSTQKTKIIDRLSQLAKMDQILQEEVLQTPKVQRSLLDYHLNEMIVLLKHQNSEVQAYVRDHQAHFEVFEKFLTNAREKALPLDSPATLPKTSESLRECQEHYQAYRRDAIDCYRGILKINPSNAEAQVGLKKLEKRYQFLADNALKNGQFEKARSYLVALEKVNPQGEELSKLKARLKEVTNSEEHKKIEPKNSKFTEKSQVVGKPKPAKSSLPLSKKSEEPKSTVSKLVEKPLSSSTCKNCNCSELLRQLSISVKPLTAEQQTFFQTECR